MGNSFFLMCIMIQCLTAEVTAHCKTLDQEVDTLLENCAYRGKLEIIFVAITTS